MTADPWANTPQPPGHVEAANEAAKMKLDQQRKKPKKKQAPRLVREGL